MKLEDADFSRLQQVDLRLHVTTQRAARLVQAAFDIGVKAKEAEMVVAATDILRASIVFLHAGLEDFLRGTAGILLPFCARKVVDQIPLVDPSSPNQMEPKKFLLGSLLQHRSKQVGDLIAESIYSYLERRTFNSASEVAGFLGDLGITSEEFKVYLPEIDEMMKRRHRIVHQAEMTNDPEVILDAWSLADLRAIYSWPHAIHGLATEILAAIAPDTRIDRIRERRALHRDALKIIQEGYEAFNRLAQAKRDEKGEFLSLLTAKAGKGLQMPLATEIQDGSPPKAEP